MRRLSEWEKGGGAERAPHINDTPFRMAEPKFRLNARAEHADKIGLPEARAKRHQEPEGQDPRMGEDDGEVAGFSSFAHADQRRPPSTMSRLETMK